VETVNEAVYAMFLYTHKHRATTTRNEPVLRHPILLPARSRPLHTDPSIVHATESAKPSNRYRRVPLALPATALLALLD